MLGRLRAPAARALTRSFTFGAQAQRVGDVMTKGVRIIKPNESIQRAAQLMAECDTGGCCAASLSVCHWDSYHGDESLRCPPA
jgi:CBS domain-containing protein